jgi:hypothetical protein
LIDLHPSAKIPAVLIGDAIVGGVDAADAPLRHAAASAALAAAVDGGWFSPEVSLDFEFFTYGDSIDELREYIEDNWRDAHIDDGVIARAREASRVAAGAPARVREVVHATRLTRRGP